MDLSVPGYHSTFIVLYRYIVSQPISRILKICIGMHQSKIIVLPNNEKNLFMIGSYWFSDIMYYDFHFSLSPSNQGDLLSVVTKYDKVV